jgi:cell division control protein 45
MLHPAPLIPSISNNTDKLKRGIQLAMKQHQVCLQEAAKIITHRLVRTGRRFRYIILRHSPDLAWLSSHPLSLSKLALFIVDAQRETKKAALPLVLAAFQPASQLYQVVATNGSRLASPGSDPEAVEEDPLGFRNHFGMCFRQAAALVRARVKHDGFQSSVIEVNADDLKAFIHTLQTIPSPREEDIGGAY